MSKFLYETHMHTAEVSACARSTGAEQARAYKARGYAGVIVTDHFINGNSTCPKHLPWAERMRFFASGYDAVKKEGDSIGLDVFFGLEYSIRGSDFLTYGVGLDFLIAHPNIHKLGIKAYSDLIRASGGYIAQAHPYREAWYIDVPFPVEPELLDGVEVYNASMPPEVNAKAYAFARENGLSIHSGSDSHYTEATHIGGIALNHRARDIFDIIDEIKAGRVELITPGM